MKESKKENPAGSLLPLPCGGEAWGEGDSGRGESPVLPLSLIERLGSGIVAGLFAYTIVAILLFPFALRLGGRDAGIGDAWLMASVLALPSVVTAATAWILRRRRRLLLLAALATAAASALMFAVGYYVFASYCATRRTLAIPTGLDWTYSAAWWGYWIAVSSLGLQVVGSYRFLQRGRVRLLVLQLLWYLALFVYAPIRLAFWFFLMD